MARIARIRTGIWELGHLMDPTWHVCVWLLKYACGWSASPGSEQAPGNLATTWPSLGIQAIRTRCSAIFCCLSRCRRSPDAT